MTNTQDTGSGPQLELRPDPEKVLEDLGARIEGLERKLVDLERKLVNLERRLARVVRSLVPFHVDWFRRPKSPPHDKEAI